MWVSETVPVGLNDDGQGHGSKEAHATGEFRIDRRDARDDGAVTDGRRWVGGLGCGGAKKEAADQKPGSRETADE
jgi:hypothetical protein